MNVLDQRTVTIKENSRFLQIGTTVGNPLGKRPSSIASGEF